MSTTQGNESKLRVRSISQDHDPTYERVTVSVDIINNDKDLENEMQLNNKLFYWLGILIC